MADVLLPQAAMSRHDIISTILNDYGALSDDGSGNPSPYPVSPLSPHLSTRQTPTTAIVKKDKPLPPILMGFQLRVDDAGIRSVQEDNRAAEKQDLPSPPTAIISRSMSRSKRPANLKLSASNGSTAASLHSSPESASTPSTLSTAPQSRRERPLPGLPPQPPRKSSLRPPMGNTPSKASKDDNNTKPYSHISPPQFLKRKPVTKAPTEPTAASISVVQPTNLRPPNGAGGSRPHKTPDPTVPSTAPQASQSHAPSAARGITPKGTTSTSAEDTLNDRAPPVSESATTEMNPTIVPSPNPGSEESRSKNGIEERVSLDQNEDGGRSSTAIATPKHFRGKSSTGFDIFKQAAGRQSAALDPENTAPIKSPASEYPDTPQPAVNEATAYDGSLLLPPPLISLPTSAVVVRHRSQRPANCNTPEINRVQLSCFQFHARFHRSSNRYAPVACALCYREDGHRWNCTWCCLRICDDCRGNLESVPGKRIEGFLERGMDKSGAQRNTTPVKKSAQNSGIPDAIPETSFTET